MDTANQLWGQTTKPDPLVVCPPTAAQSEKELAGQWLGQLDVALQSASRASVAALFAPEGHWRDLLAFTWSITPCQGAEAIAASMVAKQGSARARGFAVAEGRTPPRRVMRAGTHAAAPRPPGR